MQKYELKKMIASDTQNLLRLPGENKIAYCFKRLKYKILFFKFKKII